MKIIMIILCIILTLSPLLCAGQQQPPETRPLEVLKEPPKGELKEQKFPEKRPPEVPTKPPKEEPKQQQPPEIRPPKVPKEQPPELVPKCKDNEIFKDGKCVKK